jgi:Rps23 Pro-64 3,4-dihydroxylase Tpa1-like proline 4-hydroxylase
VATRLASEELRAWLRDITGLSLSGSELSLSFTRFDADSFLSPHHDVSADPGYELTFLYYPNTPWPDSWGGELFFQRGDDPVQRIAPRANRLVLFEPTPEARHWVPPVAAIAPRSRFAVAGWYLR